MYGYGQKLCTAPRSPHLLRSLQQLTRLEMEN